jgi:AcrR family transcriptional regulator
MGRRSTHTPQQLRELILDAAQDIIQDQGLAGLSAREVARRIEYSPGTIYNMFENLDDVVLHVEARVLDALDRRLGSVLTDTGNPTDRIGRLALAYLDFTHEKPRLWNLLFEHHMPADAQLPSWYQQKLEGLMGRVEEAMAPLFARASDRQRAARAVGRCARHHALHGRQAVRRDDRVASRPIDLVATYLALAPRAAPPDNNRPRIATLLPGGAYGAGPTASALPSHADPAIPTARAPIDVGPGSPASPRQGPGGILFRDGWKLPLACLRIRDVDRPPAGRRPGGRSPARSRA